MVTVPIRTLSQPIQSGKTKIFLLCPTLGYIHRGYEAFAVDCWQTLVSEPSLELTLFKGKGESSPRNITLPSVFRETPWAKILTHPLSQWSQKTGKGSRYFSHDGYLIEQVSFILNLLPYIQRHRPNVIYFSESVLGELLGYWRQLTGQKFRLLFRNGAPLQAPFHYCDSVQHMCPVYRDRAISMGEPEQRQTVLPHAFHIPSTLSILSSEDKQALRDRLGLPRDRPIILAVGALQNTHKRMNYLIQELSQIQHQPTPYLVLLGHHGSETASVLHLADQCLGSDNYIARSVNPSDVKPYYQSADFFVLPSTTEAFGRVFVEALSHGLTCLAHDYTVPHYILGETGLFADFTQPKALTQLLGVALSRSASPESMRDAAKQCHQTAYSHFSWDILRPQYLQLLHHCATQTT